MKSLVLGGALAAGLVLAPAADAQSLYTCGEGTVRRVWVVDGRQTTPVVRPVEDPLDEGTIVTEIGFEKKPIEYLVTVKLRDMVYTGRSAADVPWNFDPTSLAEGETIQICANDRQMVLDRLDGTDYRASIVRASIDTKAAGGGR